jgi:hypothetical protein
LRAVEGDVVEDEVTLSTPADLGRREDLSGFDRAILFTADYRVRARRPIKHKLGWKQIGELRDEERSSIHNHHFV